jgi:choline dehydrogenase/5-(hydroxymethyl)furfural/furfural oxidase
VLAARLSEDAAQAVVLLEAGPDWRAGEAPPQLRSLNGWRALDESACAPFQWTGLESQTHARPGAAATCSRAGLGGGSTVNGMMAIRAVPDDYDRWAAFGCPGWSYDDMLPYLRRVESDADFGDRGRFVFARGTSGKTEASATHRRRPRRHDRAALEVGQLLAR